MATTQTTISAGASDGEHATIAVRRSALVPAAAHDRRRLGDTLTRLTSDVAAVERFMVSQVSEGVGAFVRLVVLVGALVWMDWQLALASLVVAPLFWWVSTRFARLTREVFGCDPQTG